MTNNDEEELRWLILEEIDSQIFDELDGYSCMQCKHEFGDAKSFASKYYGDGATEWDTWYEIRKYDDPRLADVDEIGVH
jgi:hypothetical protein